MEFHGAVFTHVYSEKIAQLSSLCDFHLWVFGDLTAADLVPADFCQTYEPRTGCNLKPEPGFGIGN